MVGTELPPAGSITKGEIVDELGERALLLPSLINTGLEANERAKYYLTLLQAARHRADAPAGLFTTLRDERLAAHVADAALDHTVEGAYRMDADRYFVPGAGRVHRELSRAMAQMTAPMETAQADFGPDPSRIKALLTEGPAPEDDWVSGAYIDRLTAGPHDGADSLHTAVMEAHRALNRLQSRIATARVGGAVVYGLAEGDAELVEAFTDGVRETERLRFGHPGLATTATRVGGRLLIQNDLGTTGAHVVVVSVEGLDATITCTDVHPRRLEFLQGQLRGIGMVWSDPRRRGGAPTLGDHYLVTGRRLAADRRELAADLRRIGSRLVFVLDWNRARKRLGRFLSKEDAVAVLSWAAENDLGHMAFLALGAERLIYDAVELAAQRPARYGEPLIDVLGRDATLAITRFALKAAAEGMLAGKSALLIRDELRAEALHHMQASHRRLLDADAEHAGLVVECAQTLRAVLIRLDGGQDGEFLQRAVRRCADWEHRADQILVEQRNAARRIDGGAAVTALTEHADDAIDALEEAVFLLSLLPADCAETVRRALDPLATITMAAAREYLKAVETARLVVGTAAPEDLEDLLVAVDHVTALEHEADGADRAARASLVAHAADYRTLYLADGVSRETENAADALTLSALGLRDHVLDQLPVR